MALDPTAFLRISEATGISPAELAMLASAQPERFAQLMAANGIPPPPANDSPLRAGASVLGGKPVSGSVQDFVRSLTQAPMFTPELAGMPTEPLASPIPPPAASAVPQMSPAPSPPGMFVPPQVQWPGAPPQMSVAPAQSTPVAQAKPAADYAYDIIRRMVPGYTSGPQMAPGDARAAPSPSVGAALTAALSGVQMPEQPAPPYVGAPAAPRPTGTVSGDALTQALQQLLSLKRAQPTTLASAIR